jgi:hypothetical protein
LCHIRQGTVQIFLGGPDEDMDGKEAEPTGRRKSGNNNEHVEGKPLIASNWYKDTKDERYKGSTEWLLVDWLNLEDNFNHWINPGEEKTNKYKNSWQI